MFVCVLAEIYRLNLLNVCLGLKFCSVLWSFIAQSMNLQGLTAYIAVVLQCQLKPFHTIVCPSSEKTVLLF